MKIFIVRLIAIVAFGLTALSSFDANALTLTGVKSRKTHGTPVQYDLPIDSSQAFGTLVTIEPRDIGIGHVIVFQFDETILSIGIASSTDAFGPAGSVTAAITGASNMPTNNEVSVTLTGIPDNKRVLISLPQVNGVLDVSASMGFLVGDVNSTRTTNSTDVSSVKARAGQSANSATFRFDLNASGAINASDISAVKVRSGRTLVSANEVSLLVSKPGTGSGSVSSAPAGINCGAACAANFTQSTSVALTATANIASTFMGWSGSCTGVSPSITVVLAASFSCIATFTAVPMAAGLAWDAVTSANLSGYRVYFGTAPGTYIQAAGQGLDVGNITTYMVTGLATGIRYYFAVRAYDASGTESAYSNEVFKDIL